jgi:RND family efflux transporter MFP subunit
VAALAEGVLERLLVVEGQLLKAGEPVAQLNDAEARLALKAAVADLRLRQAEVASARAARTAARTNLEQPVHLQSALAEAEGMLVQKENELSTVPYQLRAAQARLGLARIDYEGKKKAAASGSLPEIQLQQARTEQESAAAAAEELEGRAARLRREVEALRTRRDALRKRLELKTDEIRQVADAEALVEAGEARVQQAQVAVDTARLRLERMVVRAPAPGRVLALVARPGTRVMGLAPGAMQDSSTVVTLYNPELLQVRADVRLEDVPRVQPGQRVRIETPAAPAGPLDGEVLYATSQADIQKNTLQVKVAVPSPPPTIRPEMLVHVTFLAPPAAEGTETTTARLRLFVPRSLVESGEGGSRLWVADQAAGLARHRAVKLGLAGGDLVEVIEGVSPGDRLIASGREGLRDGERIRVTGEDAAGVSLGAGTKPARLQRLPDAGAGK